MCNDVVPIVSVLETKTMSTLSNRVAETARKDAEAAAKVKAANAPAPQPKSTEENK